MSIIRVGLAETSKFSEGWEAIFGKKHGAKKVSAPKKAKQSKATSAKKKVRKKK